MPERKRWLTYETHALPRYARGTKAPIGFGWVDQDGEVGPTHPVESQIIGRITFTFSLGVLMRIPGCRRYIDHGVRTLSGPLRGPVNGGWYSAIGPESNAEGRDIPVDRDAHKECYQHTFMLLVAATATTADRPDGRELLRDAIEIQGCYWWDENQQMPVKSYAVDFIDPEDYRGVNAAMHTVEAYPVTADVASEVRWLERALKITDFAVGAQIRKHGWRLPEHYSTPWEPVLSYNRDESAHPFRSYDVTPGHGLEWVRLTVQLHGAFINRPISVPEWMLEAAKHILEQTHIDGRRADGAPGLVYTMDFGGRPVAHECIHWVVCEGISALAAIRQVPFDGGRGEIDVEHYEHYYRAWTDHAEGFLIEALGVWAHELDRGNRPSTRTWAGHPNAYHALQAILMAHLSVWSAIGQALAEGRFDESSSLLSARVSKPHRRGFSGRVQEPVWKWGRTAGPHGRRVGRTIVPQTLDPET